jgi:hypothetical protein
MTSRVVCCVLRVEVAWSYAYPTRPAYGLRLGVWRARPPLLAPGGGCGYVVAERSRSVVPAGAGVSACVVRAPARGVNASMPVSACRRILGGYNGLNEGAQAAGAAMK